MFIICFVLYITVFLCCNLFVLVLNIMYNVSCLSQDKQNVCVGDCTSFSINQIYIINFYLGHFVEAKGNLNTSKQFLCDFFFSLSLKVLKYEDEVYGI